MNKIEFREFLTLLMCCDPWPVRVVGSIANETTIKNWADGKAKEFGYLNWIDAYHKLDHE